MDSIAGMTQPPPADLWRVFQSAFGQMHAELLDFKQRAGREDALDDAPVARANSGRDAIAGGAKKKFAFGPQASSGPADPAAAAPNTSQNLLASYRSSDSSGSSRNSFRK